MKSKLLFIAPDYYGFNKVVAKGFNDYSGYNVIDINSTEKYRYKNFGERIINFFSKIFLNRNIKKINKGKHIKSIIEKHDNFDIVIINRPDVLKIEDLDLAINKSLYSIALLWDSLEKVPINLEILNKFNKCCSFDNSDCKSYGFEKITNFYFSEEKSFSKKIVSYLATYDDRMDKAFKIFDNLSKQNLPYKAKIFSNNKLNEIKNYKNIKIFHEIIPFEESYKYYLNSKFILDIAHENQKGLSFRPFEAMGLRKKLITTNANIINYDFYNKKNIFVIFDVNNFQLDNEFLESEYEELDPYLYKKYFIKNWIKIIISHYEK